MATVTVGKTYFEALVRKAEIRPPGNAVDATPSLSNNVIISKAEHDYLLRAVREYSLLKNALYQGGLSADTLDTLLSSQGAAEDDLSPDAQTEGRDTRLQQGPASLTLSHSERMSPHSDNTAVSDGILHTAHSHSYNKILAYGEPDECMDILSKFDDEDQTLPERIPVHDQRTILITNLAGHTTHKDLADVVRGGRVLDIHVRNDRSATVSFVEGASDYLAYTKRNDVYLHNKRLEFRWNDRQFHVPPHVANKIAGGASRNLVVRGAEGKLTEYQIRDHLDHIHNLIVVDINFKNGDAYISLNSIHNALFARTCMMSRTAYKGLYIGWYPDECAAPLPRLALKVHTPVPPTVWKPKPTFSNRFSLLDVGSDEASDSEECSYITSGF